MSTLELLSQAGSDDQFTRLYHYLLGSHNDNLAMWTWPENKNKNQGWASVVEVDSGVGKQANLSTWQIRLANGVFML